MSYAEAVLEFFTNTHTTAALSARFRATIYSGQDTSKDNQHKYILA